MIKNLAKSQAMIRELKDKLEKRIAGAAGVDTVRELQDANGYPVLILSKAANEAAGQPVIAIRLAPIATNGSDIFGNAAAVYSPHVADVAFELRTGGQLPSPVDMAKVLFECSRIGVRIAIKPIANATAVTVAAIDAAAAADQLDELYWPLKGN